MRSLSKVTLVLVGLSLTLPAFAADRDPKKDAIKARQAEMQLRKFNAGPLFAMAKGDMPYDAKTAQTLANNLKLLLDLDNGRAWMKGTSNEDYPDETTALPKIWNTWPKIADYGKEYAKAVNDLAAVAGNGADALRGKIKALGGACKDCHDDFREEDE